jgi:hypothetical protein
MAEKFTSLNRLQGHKIETVDYYHSIGGLTQREKTIAER